MSKGLTYRLLEIFPGFLTWNIILFPVWGSFLIPAIVAYFVLFFDIFWLYRAFTMSVNAVLAHFKMRAAEKHDWLSEGKKLTDFAKVCHLLIIPTYKEPLSTLLRTLEAISQQDFPLKKISIIWATEEREGPEAQKKYQQAFEQYGHLFANFILTTHPDILGEIKGKSSNEAWAISEGYKLLFSKNANDRLDEDFAVVTTCDADVRFHRKYFAALTVCFLRNPKRYLTFWQGTILFYNNIWKIPFPGRVTNAMGTVWNMAMQLKKDRLVNFSTYSLSLRMLKGVGYWDTDVIPEDWRIFFKCYYHFDGLVETEPIFLPLYADAAESKTFWGTLYNQYKQYQRWAWGVSDQPRFIFWWLKKPTASFFDKTLRMVKALEDHLLWPTQWFMLTLGITLPTLLNPSFSRTVLGLNLGSFSQQILNICLLFLFFMLIVDFIRRPNPPGRLPYVQKIFHYVEFLAMPVVGFFLGALPGIDAHTRLMLGKYLEYRVTEKV